jgi:hypothetical protein
MQASELVPAIDEEIARPEPARALLADSEGQHGRPTGVFLGAVASGKRKSYHSRSNTKSDIQEDT